MTLTIELAKETERVLRQRAERRGKKVNDYVEELLEREAESSFEELVRPIHEETRKLGLTVKDIEELVDSEVAEYRREKPLRCR